MTSRKAKDIGIVTLVFLAIIIAVLGGCAPKTNYYGDLAKGVGQRINK